MVDVKTKTKTSTPVLSNKRLLSSGLEDSFSTKQGKQPRTKSPGVELISEISEHLQDDDEFVTDGDSDEGEPSHVVAEANSEGKANSKAKTSNNTDYNDMFQAMALALADDDFPLTKSLARIVKKNTKPEFDTLHIKCKTLNDKIDQLDAKVNKLETRVLEQDMVISDQVDQLEKHEAEITNLSMANANLQKIVNKHQVQIDKFEIASNKLDIQIDELDQYGRRNLLRVNGIPESNENTDDLIIKLATEKLKIDLTKDDLEKPRAIVVKF